MSEAYANCIGKMCDGGDRMTYDHDGAMREPSTGKGRYDLVSPFAMQRIALWYELGSQKYAPRNWEKGIPFGRCIDSAKRHIDKFLMGKTDEDHLAAACWNIMAIMHYQMLGMDEFDDIPKYNVRKGSVDSCEVKTIDVDRYDFRFDTQNEAVTVLNTMKDLLSDYATISVADYRDICGFESEYQDNKYVWTDLRGAEVFPYHSHWRIKLPAPKKITNEVRKVENNKEENK